MHKGRVLQVAPPETIYTRPANRTVAAFVGTPNLLEAKARDVRRAPGATLAHVEGEGWAGWCSAPDDLQPGEAITVIVRPEVIQLARVGGARPRESRGRVWCASASSAEPATSIRCRSAPAPSAWKRRPTTRWRRAPPSRSRWTPSTPGPSGPESPAPKGRLTQRVEAAPSSVTCQSLSVSESVPRVVRALAFP